MERIPRSGEIYQHFKGNLYRIVTLAEHTETGECLVIYQALYGNFQVYARPLPMFMSEVDHEKYPQVQAKYRFTLLPLPESVTPEMPQPESVAQAAEQAESVTQMAEQAESVAQVAEQAASVTQVAEQAAEQTPVPDRQAVQKENPTADRTESGEEEFTLAPGLLRFLEADSYEEKLEVLASLAGVADEEMLNTIAVSLDLELSEGSMEEKFDTLKNCLLTLEKYECNRLR